MGIVSPHTMSTHVSCQGSHEHLDVNVARTNTHVHGRMRVSKICLPYYVRAMHFTFPPYIIYYNTHIFTMC